MRHLLKQHIPGFGVASNDLLELDLGEDAAMWLGRNSTVEVDERDGVVRRTLIRTLFRNMFGAPIDKETLQAFIDYATWGATCVLGKAFHSATAGLILNRVTDIRARLRQGILATPVGQKLQAAAAQAVKDGLLPGITDEERSGMALIRQIADGAAFAGMLGTTHLTTHALHRLDSHPAYYVPLYQQDPTAFLHEEARVDPPVTSVTAVLTDATSVEIGPRLGRRTFDAGTSFQVAISTANKDPIVFGGAHHSRAFAAKFDPHRDNSGESLSWNGRLEDVQAGTAPRGCPGYRLSMALANSLVSMFAPSAATPPAAVSPESQIAQSTPPTDQVVAKRNAGNTLRSLVEDEHSADFHVTLIQPETWAPNSFDKLAFGLWLAACLMSCGYLWSNRHPLTGELGNATLAFLFHMVAQATFALGFLLQWEWLQVQGSLNSACAFLAFAAVTHYRDSRSRLGDLYCMLALVLWLCLSCLSAIVFVRFGPVPTVHSVATLFWSMGVAAAAWVVLEFYWYALAMPTEWPVQTEMLLAARHGVFGMVVGVLALAAPMLSQRWGYLVQSGLNTCVHLPAILGAVIASDKAFVDPIASGRRNGCVKLTMRVGFAALLVTAGLGVWGYEKLTSGDLCQWEPVYPLPGTPEYNLCTQSPLSRVDPYARLVFAIVKSHVNHQNPADEEATAVLEPKFDSFLRKVEVVPGTGLQIPIEDEDDVTAPSWLQRFVEDLLFHSTLRNADLLATADKHEPWKSKEEAHRVLSLAAGNWLPSGNGNWTGVDLTSDDALAHMTFAGFAGQRLTVLSESIRAVDPDGSFSLFTTRVSHPDPLSAYVLIVSCLNVHEQTPRCRVRMRFQ